MTVGKIIKTLIKTDNYLEERMKVSDEMIDMIKTCMPFDYDLFKEKEEAYLDIVKMLKN